MKSTYLKEPESYRLIKGGNIRFYAHFHQQVELVYCTTGEVQLVIEDKLYTLYEGDVAFVFPNRHHCYQRMEEGKNNQVYLLLFYPSLTEMFCADWITKLPEKPVLRREQLPEFFPQLWEQFYEEYTKQPELYMFKAYTALLVAHMMPKLKLQPLQVQTASAESQQDVIQAVLNYVDQHFTENISLTSVARELGFSTTLLSRTFSKTIGNNFMTHVNSLRISHAKRLLRSSSYSVSEIGYLSGFQSKRTFFRNFKEVCGMTPSEYREKHTR